MRQILTKNAFIFMYTRDYIKNKFGENAILKLNSIKYTLKIFIYSKTTAYYVLLYIVLPPQQIKRTVRLCRRIKNWRRIK